MILESRDNNDREVTPYKQTFVLLKTQCKFVKCKAWKNINLTYFDLLLKSLQCCDIIEGVNWGLKLCYSVL